MWHNKFINTSAKSVWNNTLKFTNQSRQGSNLTECSICECAFVLLFHFFFDTRVQAPTRVKQNIWFQHTNASFKTPQCKEQVNAEKKCFKQIVTLYKVSVKMLCSLQPTQIHHWRHEKILSSAHFRAHGIKCVKTENYALEMLESVLDHWLPLLPWLAEVAQAAEISYFNSFTNSLSLSLASEIITLLETEGEN